MIRHLLLDIDDTLLDFRQQEAMGLTRAFADLGLTFDPARQTQYAQINRRQWQRMDAGEITLDQVLYGRFEIFFRELGIDADPRQMEDRYRQYLATGSYPVPGAVEAVKALAQRYDLYIASNGLAQTQYPRLDHAGLTPYLKGIFLSQDLGFHKPEREYFDACFDRIPHCDRDQVMIIGDMLPSDILGGLNAGIHTCWFNYRHLDPDPAIVPEYTVYDWDGVLALL